MSDIQEEQKRLYKRAEENDKEKWIDISKENRRLLKEIHNREINELQDKCNKQKEILDKIKEYIKNTNELYMVENYEEEGLMTPIKNIKELLEEIE